ncbi:hypothetical protein Tco_0267088 [Tanacetum coccineum]
MLIDSINNGPFQFKEITVPTTETTTEHKRLQELKDLTPEEKIQKSCDIKATNIILLGLLPEWSRFVTAAKQAKDLHKVNFGNGKVIGIRVINTVGDVKAKQTREEQQKFLVDGLEDLDSDCDDIYLYITSILKADHVDAFDPDCDEAPTASAIFMARISPAVQETEYSKHLVSNNDSYDELTSDMQTDILMMSILVSYENDAAQMFLLKKKKNAKLFLL